MGELETTTIVGIGGFAVGLVFGAVVHRTNFCTMGAISDLVLMGDGRRFSAWVLAIAVAIIGTHALHFGGVVNIDKSIHLTSNLGFLGATLGGAMFGFGMTQAGGCGSRTLVRLGAGNLKSLVVTLVLGIVAYMTWRGLLADTVQLETATNIALKARGLGDMAGTAVVTVNTNSVDPLQSHMAHLANYCACTKVVVIGAKRTRPKFSSALDKIQSEDVCRLAGVIGLGARSAVASGRSTGSRATLGCNPLRSRKTSASLRPS